ncbi:MAG TPA: hypothetical protein DCE65_03350 [Clostridiales bacterium]|nr:hypothetical protein [Clostridiales bacterium]
MNDATTFCILADKKSLFRCFTKKRFLVSAFNLTVFTVFSSARHLPEPAECVTFPKPYSVATLREEWHVK